MRFVCGRFRNGVELFRREESLIIANRGKAGLPYIRHRSLRLIGRESMLRFPLH